MTVDDETMERMIGALRQYGGEGEVMHTKQRDCGAMAVTVRTTRLSRIVVLLVPAGEWK